MDISPEILIQCYSLFSPYLLFYSRKSLLCLVDAFSSSKIILLILFGITFLYTIQTIYDRGKKEYEVTNRL